MLSERTSGFNPFSDEGFECLLQGLQEAGVEVLDYSCSKDVHDYLCVDFVSFGGTYVRVSCFGKGLITVCFNGCCINVHPEKEGRPTVGGLLDSIVGFRRLGC